MKIELRCGGCGRGYLVDPDKVPPEGAVQACQTCGTAIELRPRSPRAATRPVVAPDPEPSVPAAAQPVVCPRCGLHFSPERAPAPPAADRRPRVLLVEDMDFFEEVARQALEATTDLVAVKTVAEAADWWHVVTGPIEPAEFSEDDRAYLAEAARLLSWGDDPWHGLIDALKAATGRKGKALFQPLRLALTGRVSGPEMAVLLPLIGEREARARLERATVSQ